MISSIQIDARPDTSIGGRASGYGPAANIGLANNIKVIVREAVKKGLHNYGFRIVPYRTKAVRRLTVRIVALHYSQRAGLISAGIRINSTLEGSANVKGKTFDRVYRGNRSKQILFTPTEHQDNRYINNALSNTLNQLLNDKQMLNFLAR